MINEYQQAYEKVLSLANMQRKIFSNSPEELEASMARTRGLLATLGDPQKKLKIVHVAGSSGKGSVVNYLHEILVASGAKVGSYCSPHTTTYLERFKWGKALLPAKSFVEAVNDLVEGYERHLQLGRAPLSFFELSTCLAFLAFEKEGADWCVLETGLGGRWDATNVIPVPQAAVITSISLDHTEVLGNSLSQIAQEKAGIIKGGKVICGVTEPSLQEIFVAEAGKCRADIRFISDPKECFVDEHLGTHQNKNAALASAVAKTIGIDYDSIEIGLAEARQLPCRFEKVQDKPVVILDGAHSPAKMETTVEMIKALGKPVHAVFGCMSARSAKEMLELLEPVAESISTTRFQMTHRAGANPFSLLKKISADKQGQAFLDQNQALDSALDRAGKTGVVVVTGSLYLCGELRGRWISEKDIVKKSSSFPHK